MEYNLTKGCYNSSQCCKDCKYVRKACKEGYVACGYLSAIKHGIIPLPILSDFKPLHLIEKDKPLTFTELMEDYTNFRNEHEVYEGWASLRVRPDSIDSGGIISNYCIIVTPDNVCNHFKNYK